MTSTIWRVDIMTFLKSRQLDGRQLGIMQLGGRQNNLCSIDVLAKKLQTWLYPQNSDYSINPVHLYSRLFRHRDQCDEAQHVAHGHGAGVDFTN
jgi:hypothetical protein